MKKTLKLNGNMSQEELIKLAIKKMDSTFPISERHRDIYTSDRDNNFYFSGLWHMRDYLVTPEIIQNLKDGAKMLSVGSGDGHLERLLVKGFRVPLDNIHVSDISIHPKLLVEGFSNYEFDMTKEWPELLNSFDYVTFPESMGVALTRVRGNCITCRFHEDTVKIVESTLKGKKISLSDRNFYLGLIEQDIPQAMPTYNLLRQAFERLNHLGQIRVSRCGGIQYEQMKTYVGLKFKKDYPHSTYEFPVAGPSIISKH